MVTTFAAASSRRKTPQRIPVLMMSGHLPEMAQTAETCGNVVATLPKPFLSAALIDAVEKILATAPSRLTLGLSATSSG